MRSSAFAKSEVSPWKMHETVYLKLWKIAQPTPLTLFGSSKAGACRLEGPTVFDDRRTVVDRCRVKLKWVGALIHGSGPG